ncbi:hypothetical protein GCM10025867_46380 (plasmid) [Frondihabitans sucicola]|uniref:Uncharacterized protein n=1 Tax=Frondihabitans sucicola TaxID=1268041 RepID=A0ABM8GVA3_9MICO|nr:hypothetical protein [Frondihabitans sucicola]BDZ52397.1 hypothetical protein GCM10025867_46380 [Frondihabitans sucicola]
MTTTALPHYDWTEHESGLDLDSGDVGGDYQASAAASRRFWRQLPDGTFCVITSYYYATQKYYELDAEGNRTGSESDDAESFDSAERFVDIENMTEYLWCTDREDPGSTEINSNYKYEYPLDMALDNVDRAWALAQAQARMESAAAYDLYDGSFFQ